MFNAVIKHIGTGNNISICAGINCIGIEPNGYLITLLKFHHSAASEHLSIELNETGNQIDFEPSWSIKG